MGNNTPKTRNGAHTGNHPSYGTAAGCHGYQHFKYASVDDQMVKLSVPDVVPDDLSSTSGSYTVDEDNLDGDKETHGVNIYCRGVVV